MTQPAAPDDDDDMARRWNARYQGLQSASAPALVLREWAHFLPPTGVALDFASGLGGNALWLAEQGMQVSAWDLSATAIAQLRETATRLGLTLSAQVRDLIADPPPARSFDLICVVHFLDRDLAPKIADALRPGGLLFYQTFTQESLGRRGPTNPAYRLGPNELLELFQGLIVRGYRDEGTFAPSDDRGLGELALMVAQRATD